MPAPLHTSTDALRHVLVTLDDRFEHAVGDAPSGFAAFEAGQGARTPLALVRHVRGLMRFAAALWAGTELDEAPPLDWASEVAAWRHDLAALDALFRAQPTPSGSVGAHQVLQGPLLDAATHIGQLTLLRRLAGAPVERRSYWQVSMAELDAATTPAR
ncbi:MAG: hypothetical protein P1P87_07840 [Trueperaceae bacterium]|nr:hypothetical protein [Trueperaceae bacterium]